MTDQRIEEIRHLAGATMMAPVRLWPVDGSLAADWFDRAQSLAQAVLELLAELDRAKKENWYEAYETTRVNMADIKERLGTRAERAEEQRDMLVEALEKIRSNPEPVRVVYEIALAALASLETGEGEKYADPVDQRDWDWRL